MFGRCLQYFGGFGMGGMMFMGIFWIALIVLVVYLVSRLMNDRSGKASTEESALDILKKELAKGNITEEEFDRKKKLL
jgi:putative membrane protein